MHQRRIVNPRHAVRVALLLELGHGWRTVQELADRVGINRRTVGRSLPVLAQDRRIFKRWRETQYRMVAEYRTLPEARQVRPA